MGPEYIEGITASLVREYLSRKGLKDTLHLMDQELPRNDDSISNRPTLIKLLHIEKMIKKNKEQEHPLKAMLEVMTKYFLEKSVAARPGTASQGRTKSAKGPSRLSSRSESQDAMEAADVEGDAHPIRTPGMGQNSNDMVLEDSVGGETVVGEGRAGVMTRTQSPNSYRPVSSKHRGMVGQITSSMDDRERRKQARMKVARPESSLRADILNSPDIGLKSSDRPPPYSVGGTVQDRLTAAAAVNRDLDNIISETESKRSPRNSPVPSYNGSYNRKADTGAIRDVLDMSSPVRNRKPAPRYTRWDDDSLTEIKSESETANRGSSSAAKISATPVQSKPKPKPVKSVQKLGDLEMGDIDDDLDEELSGLDLGPGAAQKAMTLITDSKPIDIQTAVELKALVLGSASQNFNDEWKYQSFAFCDLPKLKYGIIQKKGGPCGVIASVQACMLQQLLFCKEEKPTVESLEVGRQERSDALAKGLALIFWRAGDHKRAIVALPSGRSIFSGGGRYKPDQITETLVLNHFTSQEDLTTFMKQHVAHFEMDGNSGAILTVYSAILSRTIKQVREDMDEPTGKLMGAHGYCTQDMVNLLLSGRAVSNVFNGVVELDSGTGPKTILKGVPGRSDIGLLSLFEHYKSCEVGTYMKTPHYPIWVVCSESHFSVIFCVRKELLGDWKYERHFDLYYFDGLGKQDQEIRLTVDTSNKYFQPPSEDELVSPLEHCIRTKWKGAEIDWNGTDPLL